MFSKRLWGPSLLLLLGALMIAVSVLRRSPPPAADAPTQPQPRTDASRADVRRVRPIALPPADAAGLVSAMHDREAEQATRVAEVGRSALQRRYQDEGVDPAWAAATERVLLSQGRGGLISQAAADPQDLRVQCRSTVCRVEASFATPSQLDDWFPLFALAAGDVMSKAGMHRSVGPDGRPHVEVYAFARRQ